MNIIAVILTLIKMFYYTRRNPREVISKGLIQMYTFKFLQYLFDSWSELMFWLLFFSCSNIFISYKLQMNAFFLLPELGDASEKVYASFKIIMLITLIFKFISVLMRIIEQTTMDIYLVDFEPPH